jgi:hypothetical protein
MIGPCITSWDICSGPTATGSEFKGARREAISPACLALIQSATSSSACEGLHNMNDRFWDKMEITLGYKDTKVTQQVLRYANFAKLVFNDYIIARAAIPFAIHN